MLKMSFYYGTLDMGELKDFIKNTDKEIRYTYGFTSDRKVPKVISKESALEILEKESFVDAEETGGTLDLNVFDSNHMW